MKRKSNFKTILRECSQKTLALVLIVLQFICGPALPEAFALTGGPSQPEVQGFEPVSTSQMVDLFSGDFTYNIPLVDVGGYPINLSYHSGIMMDQEASWVGLGWSLNPGALNRQMRGIPDDFDGDPISLKMNRKANVTLGCGVGIGAEFVGLSGTSLGYNLSVQMNNMRGVGVTQSITAGFKIAGNAKFPMNVGLGLNSSNQSGMTVDASASFKGQQKVQNSKKEDVGVNSLSVSVGSAINSRAGMKQLTVGHTSTFSSNKEWSGKASAASNTSFDLGQPTYVTSVGLPTLNVSGSGRLTVGAEGLTIHPNASINASFAVEGLLNKERISPAYGYMHMEKGQFNDDAIMDFNREKDGMFTETTPALPLTSLTYDVFAASAQGAGGSFKTQRSDVGFVRSEKVVSHAGDFNASQEVGFGMVNHNGGDVSLNYSNSSSGMWKKKNHAKDKLKYHAESEGDALYEKYYFKSAAERSVTNQAEMIDRYGGYRPVRVELKKKGAFNVQAEANLVDDHGNDYPLQNNKAVGRDVRNQVLSQLTWKEAKEFGLVDYPENEVHPDHHLAQFTLTNTSGQRYVYGQPAYNEFTKDVTFAVGSRLYGNDGLSGDCSTGLVDYNDNVDNALDGNKKGLQNYVSKKEVPAYAHSYLLSAVVSPDYIDSDGIRGPSENDLGTYTKFNYSKVDGYLWRVPFNHANFNEGIKSDKTDDMASYLFGEKELFYLQSIETKNYVAIFHTSTRHDAWGVQGENGGLGATSVGQKKLDKISLYARPEYEANGADALPLKEVHFEYDYSLCPGVDNNDGVAEMQGSVDLNEAQGKLSLKRLYFTYQNSFKGKYTPYNFSYAFPDVPYNMKNYDRWGCYKGREDGACAYSNNDPATPEEFPYVDQNKETADEWTQSWTLNQIDLPSGGTIHVEYESDDYAYVQDKRAMQMFKVIGVADNTNWNSLTIDDLQIVENPTSLVMSTGSDESTRNRLLVFELEEGHDNLVFLNDYFKGIRELYFRFFTHMGSGDYDYVSGYAQIGHMGLDTRLKVLSDGDKNYGVIKLKALKLKDNGGDEHFSPIAKAAVKYAQSNLPRRAYDDTGMADDDMNFGKDFFTALLNSNFVKNMTELLQGPDRFVWENNFGRRFMSHKSFIRLNNPNMAKLGGGCRVKKLYMSDNWDQMTEEQESSEYGQVYEYTLEDGQTSSGVATYEPLLGGDENPFRQPVRWDVNVVGAPDKDSYQEAPFGESFFPSASVGYSRVTVKNLQYANVKRHATGKTVNEYYTAKDYPIITDRTEKDYIPQKNQPFQLASLFKIDINDHATVSQGFYIETNDMHGKPKTVQVYAENKNQPISQTRYIYHDQAYGQANRLKSEVLTLDKYGNQQNHELGVFQDFVVDFRQAKTVSGMAGAQLNLDAISIPPFIPYLPIPSIWPRLGIEETQFRSVSSTKLIDRKGILKEVISEDLGAVISAQNVAYSAETGEVLLTMTNNEYSDQQYQLNFPAYWKYPQMGMAYENVGAEITTVFAPGGKIDLAYNDNIFTLGDEVHIEHFGLGNVVELNDNYVRILTKEGVAPGTSSTGPVKIKVVRSGKKNQMAASMASLVALSNPLEGVKSGNYSKVLTASAAEYKDEWPTYCNCVSIDQTSQVNDYAIGRKGNWRVSRDFSYLTGRTQAFENNNTNLRTDGLLTSFSPYYAIGSDGEWAIQPENWTFAEEITMFSPFGLQLESVDAIGVHSAASYGYHSSRQLAVAANARHREIGFDNFEDYDFNTCSDDHFRLGMNGGVITDEYSHTGNYSLQVSSGNPVRVEWAIENCDNPGCDIELLFWNHAGYNIIYPVNGTAPYQFEWEILDGNPEVSLNADGTGVEFNQNPQLTFKIKVKVTDSEGCSETGIFENNSSN